MRQGVKDLEIGKAECLCFCWKGRDGVIFSSGVLAYGRKVVLGISELGWLGSAGLDGMGWMDGGRYSNACLR